MNLKINKGATICLILIPFLSVVAVAQEISLIKNTAVGRYGEAQVELICPNNVRILFDVADLESLSESPTSNDILLTTHTHPDHFIKEFADSFPGIQLCMEEGEINRTGIHIKSIVASHTPDMPSDNGKGDNYIIIADIGDLRVVHFGDLGQKQLTPKQLSALSNRAINIAIMMLSEPPIEIIDLLKPKVLIPTHLWGSPATKSIIQRWPPNRVDNTWIKLNKDSLPTQTTLLFIGDWGERIGKMYKLPLWKME